MIVLMRRNIVLAYFINSFNYSWFWLGVWIFYYLRFTDYAGIGLIETSLIITRTVAEIPTGAVADLLGKKVTLLMSFGLQIFGGLSMAFAPNIYYLILGTTTGGLGGALYSGAFEALIYDSLKQNHRESDYPKIYGNLNSLQFLMIAATGILGGFLYTVNFRWPFILTALFYFFCLVLGFFLSEPKMDTVKFSLKNFIQQNKNGFRQLFTKLEIKKLVIYFLIISSILVISDEVLNDALAVEFGFKPYELGIFLAILSLLSAAASRFSAQIINRLKVESGSIAFGLLLSLTYVVSPISGIFGSLSLVIRTIVQAVFNNFSSNYLNRHIDSQNRATTLSSFNMIKSLPYVATAYFLGSLMDKITAKYFALYLGIIFAFLLLLNFIVGKIKNRA